MSTGLSRKGRGRLSRRQFDPNDKCYQCGDRGHYAYDCYRYSKRGRRSRYTFPPVTGFCLCQKSSSVIVMISTPFFFLLFYSLRSRSHSRSRSRSRSHGRRHRTRSRSRSRSYSRYGEIFSPTEWELNTQSPEMVSLLSMWTDVTNWILVLGAAVAPPLIPGAEAGRNAALKLWKERSLFWLKI